MTSPQVRVLHAELPHSGIWIARTPTQTVVIADHNIGVTTLRFAWLNDLTLAERDVIRAKYPELNCPPEFAGPFFGDLGNGVAKTG